MKTIEERISKVLGVKINETLEKHLGIKIEEAVHTSTAMTLIRSDMATRGKVINQKIAELNKLIVDFDKVALKFSNEMEKLDDEDDESKMKHMDFIINIVSTIGANAGGMWNKITKLGNDVGIDEEDL